MGNKCRWPTLESSMLWINQQLEQKCMFTYVWLISTSSDITPHRGQIMPDEQYTPRELSGFLLRSDAIAPIFIGDIAKLTECTSGSPRLPRDRHIEACLVLTYPCRLLSTPFGCMADRDCSLTSFSCGWRGCSYSLLG